MSEQPPSQPAASSLTDRLTRLSGYVQIDPHNPALLGDAFDTAMEAGRYDLARRFLDQAEALPAAAQEQQMQWRFRRASLCIANHDDREAERLLETISASVEHPAVRCNLALLSFRREAYEQALERLAPLLASPASGSGPEVAYVLALRCWHRLGHVAAALQWFEARFVQGDGLRAASATLLGVASLLALDEQRVGDAQAWSSAALASDGEQMEALVTQASLALADDDGARARQLLQHALRVNPKDGRAWSALAFVDMLDGDLDAAASGFHCSLQALPEHIGTWHGLAWCSLLQQKPEAARDAFERALALDPAFAESQGGLAVVAALQGRREEAEAFVARALRLDSKSLAARYAQAILRGEANDSQAIVKLAQRLLGSHEAAGVSRIAQRMAVNAPRA